jgi:hypothetical protein
MENQIMVFTDPKWPLSGNWSHGEVKLLSVTVWFISFDKVLWSYHTKSVLQSILTVLSSLPLKKQLIPNAEMPHFLELGGNGEDILLGAAPNNPLFGNRSRAIHCMI